MRGFQCTKCDNTEYETGQFRAVGGFATDDGLDARRAEVDGRAALAAVLPGPADAEQTVAAHLLHGGPEERATALPVTAQLLDELDVIRDRNALFRPTSDGSIENVYTLKLINNFFAMTTACAMSEAFAMADLAGLKRATLYDVMSSGPLRSGMMDWIKTNAVDQDPSALAFTISNGLKDLGYYASMADDFKVPSFISPATKNALNIAKSTGWGEKYVPEMVDFIADIYSEK